MLNFDKSELAGKTTSTSTTDFDSEMERIGFGTGTERAFREEELFDQKRRSKLQAETKEIDRNHL